MQYNCNVPSVTATVIVAMHPKWMLGIELQIEFVLSSYG